MSVAELMTMGQVFYTVGKFVGLYSGYIADRRMIDDIEVRRHLMIEMGKARAHLSNALECVYRLGDPLGAESTKKVMEELYLFSVESDILPVGRKHPFFQWNTMIPQGTINELIKLDFELLTKAKNATECARRLETQLISNISSGASEYPDVRFEMDRLRQYVTTLRNRLRDRGAIIKCSGCANFAECAESKGNANNGKGMKKEGRKCCS